MFLKFVKLFSSICEYARGMSIVISRMVRFLRAELNVLLRRDLPYECIQDHQFPQHEPVRVVGLPNEVVSRSSQQSLFGCTVSPTNLSFPYNGVHAFRRLTLGLQTISYFSLQKDLSLLSGFSPFIVLCSLQGFLQLNPQQDLQQHLHHVEISRVSGCTVSSI